MNQPAPKSRRVFFRTAIAALGAFGVWFADRMVERNAALPENSTTSLDVPLPAGNAIRFYDQAIVITDKDQVRVFSSACPHLGCHINGVEENELVCPCHGSRFNLRGETVLGPAMRGLQPLSFQLDRAASILHITVKS